MITEERKAILMEHERLCNIASDLMHHYKGQYAAFNTQRIAAIRAASNYAQLHQITTLEMTELKRAGRPVCTTKKQAFEQMNNFFGPQK